LQLEDKIVEVLLHMEKTNILKYAVSADVT